MVQKKEQNVISTTVPNDISVFIFLKVCISASRTHTALQRGYFQTFHQEAPSAQLCSSAHVTPRETQDDSESHFKPV